MIEAPATSGGLNASTDVVIIGADVLGLARAAAAVKHGLRVTAFEHSDITVGASIRSFGQMLVTGQPPGIMPGLTRESYTLHLDWVDKTGVFARANDALLFTRNVAEEDVLDEFMAAHAPAFGYNVRLLRSADLANLYDGRFLRHRMVLQGVDNLQLYSRGTILALMSRLTKQGVHSHFRTLMRHMEDGRLETTAGVCNAQRVVVCSGHDYQALCADQLRTLQPQVCRLQMLRATPGDGFRLERAVLTSLSCTRYGALAGLPTAQALAMQIEHQRPELAHHDVRPLMSLAPYGDWIVDGPHNYSQDARPFNTESVDSILLDLARDTFGAKLRVVERWQGVCDTKCHVPGSGTFSIARVDDRTTVALMHSGIDMGVGPALAHRHMDTLVDGTELPQWTPPASMPAAVPV